MTKTTIITRKDGSSTTVVTKKLDLHVVAYLPGGGRRTEKGRTHADVVLDHTGPGDHIVSKEKKGLGLLFSNAKRLFFSRDDDRT